jgi:ATP-binding cassette, subfamily D (ALD), peroxisomal long-chain fatty acid import protein
MITGPNGSGKSSVARLLSGIWPLFSGKISRPLDDLSEILYLPQRPYLATGSLRDQIIYPHSLDQMKEAGVTDSDLMKILKDVYLEYIPAREGGFDAVKEWKDVFSGGEKQRVQVLFSLELSSNFLIL